MRRGYSAADTFAAFYQLEELRRASARIFRTIDALMLPTAPTVYTVAQVLADPVETNTRLGHLHQLCQSARPMRACGAGGDPCRRRAFGRNAVGAGRAMMPSSLRSGACCTPMPRCRSAR